MHDNPPPGFVESVKMAVDGHGLSVLLAFALSYLRILYDDKESRFTRQVLEASIGALLVLIVGLGCDAGGLAKWASFMASGFVGILGVNWVRDKARKWASKQVG